MTSFTGYWLTRGRPHCLARWLSSSFSPLAGRASEPRPACGWSRTRYAATVLNRTRPHGFTDQRALQCSPRHLARLGISPTPRPRRKLSGASATPSRDNNSVTTIFRTPYTSDWSRCHELTDQAAETHRCDVQETLEPIPTASTLGRFRRLSDPCHHGRRSSS